LEGVSRIGRRRSIPALSSVSNPVHDFADKLDRTPEPASL
jgi:hypothetical protein